MPIFTDYQIIVSRIIDLHTKHCVIMAPITEEQELEIDNAESICIKNNNVAFSIMPNKVIFYGEIDFTAGSEDMDTLSEVNWLSDFIERGICVPSDYNFDEHCCNSPLPLYRYTQTFRPEVLTKYKYACLGKPQRIVIFNHNIHGTYRSA